MKISQWASNSNRLAHFSARLAIKPSPMPGETQSIFREAESPPHPVTNKPLPMLCDLLKK